MTGLKKISVGLAGNPNSGKTTIFNAITGSSQRVGNYAGVTVEKKEGRKRYRNIEFIIYDLPGTYSLTAYSLDEVIARDFILEEKPDVIINVLDATNIERNLFLSLQFQELGAPMICALNISDQAASMGITIDDKALSDLLGVRMIKTVGTRGEGIDELLDEVIMLYEKKEEKKVNRISYGFELEHEIHIIEEIIKMDAVFAGKYPPRWLAIKLLEKDANARKKLLENSNVSQVLSVLEKSIREIETHFGRDSEIIVSEQRYGFVHGAVSETVIKTPQTKAHSTELIDKILLNRFLGLPIFLLILWAIFQLTFKLGEYPTAWLEMFFEFLSVKASGIIPEGILRSLIVDGIIGGVGGVLSFVPLIVILFTFISFLEDTGYMARAAFIMDKFLHIFGLHGQSFLPMMLGFGCSVPAFMAARTLKNPRDRIITILVTPFMSCGAKLPVHVLLAAAFFPDNPANAVVAIYGIGAALALLSALLLRKTVLRGEAAPFVMELPPYRMPTVRAILQHVWDKTKQYLKKAGTVLLAASILIWALVTFPVIKHDKDKYEKIAENYKLSALKNRVISEEELNAQTDKYVAVLQAEERLTASFAGMIGKLIEPVIKPLGFNWKIGISIITGFAAKEIVVSTLGILYGVGADEDSESGSLRETLSKEKVFSPLTAFSMMLMMLILPPCFAAMATIRAEAGWKWLGFNLLYTSVLAWIVCFAVYRIGMLFGLGG